MLEVLVDVGTFLAGAALLGGLALRLSSGLRGRTVALYVGLAALAVGPALFTSRTQVALDFAYQFPPWRDTFESSPKAGNPLVTDVALQILPFRYLARERLLAGEAPLWSHELGTGQPLLGNAQSAPFAPLHLMAIHLPVERAITVAAAWQVLLALLGTHLLAAGLGIGRAGSVLAATACALSTFSFAWLDYPLAMAAAWIPCLLAAILAMARGRGSSLVVVACAIGLLLSGHPQIAAQGGLVAVVTALLALRRVAAEDRRIRLRRLGQAAAAACLIAAPVLVAEIDGLVESERWLDSREGRAAVSWLEPRSLVPLVAPLAYGSPRFDNWSGPGNFQETATLYGGVLPLALALSGAIWRLRKGTRSLLFAAGVALLIGFGLFAWVASGAPLLGALLDRRARFFWTLFLAVAAGRGLELVMSDARVRRAFCGLAALLGVVAASWVAPSSSPWPLAWRAAVALAALAAIASTARAVTTRGGRVVVGCTALELLVLGVPYNPVADLRRSEPPKAVVALQNAAREEAPVRVSAIGGRYLAYLPALDGLWDPRGWDPARPGVAARVARERLRGERPGRQILIRDGFDRGFLDFLGVRYVLGSPGLDVPPEWTPIWRQGGDVVWRNPDALPIFFAPRGLELVEARAEAADRALRSAPEIVAWEGPSPAAAAPSHRLEVHSIEPRPNGFGLEVRSPEAAIVASSVTWAPGWTAHGGSGARVVGRVNGAYLGVVTQPGDRRIELRYAPRGWNVALLGCLLGLSLLAVLVRRERRSEAT